MQHLLAQQKDLVLRVLYSENGRLYLCGNSGMSKSVQTVLKQIIATHHSWSEKQAEEEFFKLQEQKRVCIEAWG